MKAVVLERLGGPEVLEYRETDDPSPSSDECVVRVAATSVNRIDTWIRKGVYKVPLPHILGVDIAGEVEVAAPSRGINKGERVVVYPAITCGACEYCLEGLENMCVKRQLIGHTRNGGYAEKVAVPAGNLVRLPGSVSLEEAAALPTNFLTSWHALVTRAGIKPGNVVLVVGAGSGVGYAAIEIAKLSGATVIATVGEDWKEEKAYELGADFVINRKKKDVAEEVKAYTNGRGVDIVFEHAGSAFFETALRSLAINGSLVTLGATTGQEVKLDIRSVYMRHIKIIGVGMGTRRELLRLLDLVAKKKLKVVIDREYPLAKASEAHARMENSENFGKILLKP